MKSDDRRGTYDTKADSFFLFRDRKPDTAAKAVREESRNYGFKKKADKKEVKI